MKKYLVILAFLVLMAGVIAPHDEVSEAEEDSEVESIALMSKDGKIYWEVDGKSEKGFKIVWSENADPTYPLRDGDKYHYYTDPERNYDSLEAFDGEGEYYVRVCEYLGGECGVYSNQIIVELDDDDDDKYEEKEEYDDDKYEKDCEYKYVDGEKKYVCEDGEKYDDAYEKKEQYEYEKKMKEGSDDDKEDKVTEGSCDGCLLDDKCYYFTHRKSGMYCSYDGVFVNQSSEGLSCENNFECDSNVCVDGECISSGLIRKVLNWLSRFFG